MANTINSDGLLIRFGNEQGKRGTRTAVTTDTTKTNEMVMTVDLAGAARTIYTTDVNNSGANNGFGGLDTPIPLNALITAQRVVVVTTPAGGTNYTVGTYTQADNVSTPTTIDDDGVRTTTGTDGAQVGTQSTAPWYLAVKTTGTYTAGRIKIMVYYTVA